MRKLSAILLTAAIVLGATASADAFARGGYPHHHRARIGVFIGAHFYSRRGTTIPSRLLSCAGGRLSVCAARIRRAGAGSRSAPRRTLLVTTAPAPRPTTRTSVSAPAAGNGIAQPPPRDGRHRASPSEMVFVRRRAWWPRAQRCQPARRHGVAGTGKSFEQFRFDDGVCRQFSLTGRRSHCRARSGE